MYYSNLLQVLNQSPTLLKKLYATNFNAPIEPTLKHYLSNIVQNI